MRKEDVLIGMIFDLCSFVDSTLNGRSVDQDISQIIKNSSSDRTIQMNEATIKATIYNIYLSKRRF